MRDAVFLLENKDVAALDHRLLGAIDVPKRRFIEIPNLDVSRSGNKQNQIIVEVTEERLGSDRMF